MSRDTVKTLAGLLVIGVIVVATFLYGNAQRQSQLKHDQTVKNQQASNLKTDQPTSTATVAPPVAAAPKSTASTKPNTGTAPVQSVASNSIQGSKATVTPSKSPAASPTAKPASPKPSATPAGQVAGAATTPVTGGTGKPLPDTGSPLLGGMGLAAIAIMLLWLRRSKRSLFSALRGNRPTS